MASSSTNNTNIRLKPRFCNCGRTASIRITSNEHCNYFRWFIDDDDNDDITSTIQANVGSQTDSITEEINDLRRRLGEHDRRLQRMENIFKAMTYVIVFCVFLYFIM
ncbi:hypothetical protein ACSBR1_021233 [Camellia fascicularis]